MHDTSYNKLSPLKALLFLFYIFVPVDMVSGSLVLTNQLSLSIIFKSLVLLLVSVYMIFFAKNTRVALLLSYLLMWMALNYASYGNLSLLLESSIMLVKFLSIFIFIEFFKRAFDFGYKNQMANIIYWAYAFFVINALLGFLGYGRSMYSGNGVSIGSKGLIYAGNELGVAFLTSFVLLVAVKLQRNGNRSSIYISLSAFIIAGIMTLKSALLGVFIISIYTPYAHIKSGINGLKLKRSAAKISAITLIAVFIFCILVALFIIPNMGIIERWSYFLNKLDLLTFLLSGRNILAEQALDVYFVDYNVIEKLFGTGQKWQSLVPSQKLVEIDFIDFLMAYGMTGAGLLIALPLSILLFCGIQEQGIPRSVIYTGAWLLFILSFLAGHVFNSGTAGYLIAVLFSILRNRDVNVI